MKVRIGVGLSVGTMLESVDDLCGIVDALEELRFDSLWMSETSTGPGLDPMTALAFAAGRTTGLKLGTSVAVLPGRDPILVARQMAMVDQLSEGRFLLGLGAGENLNEHVIGRGWPPANVRHEMLDEALQIIRSLFGGEYVDFVGQHYRVDSAKLWDVADEPPKIGLAVSGAQSARLAGEYADAMIAVEPESELGEKFDLGRYHEAILAHGTLPVKYLPEVVRARLKQPR